MKLTIGLNHSLARIVEIMGPQVILEDQDAVLQLHCDPRYQHINGQVNQRNFDVFVDQRPLGQTVVQHQLLLNHRYYNLPVWGKSYQGIVLGQAGIHTPRVIGTFMDNQQQPGLTHGGYDDALVIMRPEGGANGNGIVKIPHRQAHECHCNIQDRDLDVVELRRLFPQASFLTEDPEDVPFKQQWQGEACLTEYLGGDLDEYRIIFGGKDEFWAYPRRRYTEQGFTHANNNWDDPYPEQSSEINLADDVVEPTLVDQLKKFMAKNEQLLGSIDVFCDNDGQWGVFEYASLFGHRTVPYAMVQRVYRGFFKQLVDNYLLDREHN